MVEDIAKLGDDELETLRVSKSRTRDELLDDMHAIVAEQDARVHRGAARAAIDAMAPEHRAAFLAELQATKEEAASV